MYCRKDTKIEVGLQKNKKLLFFFIVYGEQYLLMGVSFMDREGYLGQRIDTIAACLVAEFAPYFALDVNKIGGLLLVTDLAHLEVERSEQFANLGAYIMQHFGKKNLLNLAESWLLIVTKTSGHQQAAFFAALETFIYRCYKAFYNDERKESANACIVTRVPIEDIIYFCDIFLKNGHIGKREWENIAKVVNDKNFSEYDFFSLKIDNIVFLRIGEEGNQNHNNIIKKIKALKPIAKSDITKHSFPLIKDNIGLWAENFNEEKQISVNTKGLRGCKELYWRMDFISRMQQQNIRAKVGKRREILEKRYKSGKDVVLIWEKKYEKDNLYSDFSLHKEANKSAKGWYSFFNGKTAENLVKLRSYIPLFAPKICVYSAIRVKEHHLTFKCAILKKGKSQSIDKVYGRFKNSLYSVVWSVFFLFC